MTDTAPAGHTEAAEVNRALHGQLAAQDETITRLRAENERLFAQLVDLGNKYDATDKKAAEEDAQLHARIAALRVNGNLLLSDMARANVGDSWITRKAFAAALKADAEGRE